MADNMSEKDFVDKIELFYNKKGYFTEREVNSGHGIADLVLLRFNKNNCEIRLNYSQKRPLLNEYFYHVLRHCRWSC